MSEPLNSRGSLVGTVRPALPAGGGWGAGATVKGGAEGQRWHWPRPRDAQALGETAPCKLGSGGPGPDRTTDSVFMREQVHPGIHSWKYKELKSKRAPSRPHPTPMTQLCWWDLSTDTSAEWKVQAVFLFKCLNSL